MGKHLQRDLERLKREILGMGDLVREAAHKAITGYLEHRADLAAEVAQGDDLIDQKENEIEDAGLKVLALHQPVAADLRFVVMVLKVNHDLERVGDLAANMAEQVRILVTNAPHQAELPITAMSEAVWRMLRHSLDALVNLDADLAREVCAEDDEVDDMYREMFTLMEQRMQEDPGAFGQVSRLLSISRYLERIADHATNIAEDVVFMVEGESIRHQG